MASEIWGRLDSGPTYIAVRSRKHSSSTAFVHGLHFERLLEIPELEEIKKNVIEKTENQFSCSPLMEGWMKIRGIKK
jgi:hypothetical protein